MQVGHDETPKVLLIGNGINRAYKSSSWDNLLESITTKKLTDRKKEAMDNVPYPLKPVILTEDHIDRQMKEKSKKWSDFRACEMEESLLRRYADLPVDAILTTNYTYELEKALEPEFKCNPGVRCKWRARAYDGEKYYNDQLYTYFSVGEKAPPIWHIHGEAAKPDTMIIGHYYYGKLLAKMQGSVSKFIARYKSSQANKRILNLHSWMEYFLMGDVYIVGCGMELSEQDLWWLVSCKKRHFPNSRIVLYKPDAREEERLLAEAYGMRVDSSGFNGDYREYYEYVCDRIHGM
jgi:hypothetical protein